MPLKPRTGVSTCLLATGLLASSLLGGCGSADPCFELCRIEADCSHDLELEPELNREAFDDCYIEYAPNLVIRGVIRQQTLTTCRNTLATVDSCTEE